MATALCLLSLPLWAQNVERTTHGVKTSIDGHIITIDFYTPKTVRITKSAQGKSYEKKSLAVTAKPETTALNISESNASVTLKSSAVQVKLNKSNGTVQFLTAKGKNLLKEKEAAVFTPFNDAGKATFSVEQRFQLDEDEALYGLGQLQDGKMNRRGTKRWLNQGNVEDISPLFQTTKGYGVYWDNYSSTLFEDDAQSTLFRSLVGEGVDYYFMYGTTADGVIACIRELTGDVPMFPLWTYGYWQSKERYKSQNETVGVVKKYRELGIPLDGIIQDWQYWGHNYLWNAMDFKNPDFPQPKKMIDEVHNMNAHMAISIWSSFGPVTRPYRELDSKGLLFKGMETWPQSGLDSWPPNKDYPSGVTVYNCYNAEARDIYWKYLKQGIFDLGMDAWWMDSTEPDHSSVKEEDFDHQTELGSYRSVRNAYPLMTVGGVYDHQREVTSDKRVFILTRSGFVGQQRYGSNVWSGDVTSNWDSFRNQIPAGLNFSLTGMPHWNTDIGGFFAGAYNKSWNDGTGCQNPMYQELYVRWLQFGTFCPMMRSHGTDVPREIYKFGKKGEPVFDAIASAIKLRYSLLPYIYSMSWETTHNRSSMMRALVMDFPTDRTTWNMQHEYMFGPSLLVAPVVKAQYTPESAKKTDEMSGWNREKGNDTHSLQVDFTATKQASAYLPKGAVWYDFFTGEKIKGGRTIARNTTLSTFPLYVRAGSILAMGPDVQYASEKKWDNLEIRIYPGANGSFTLYEDEGDNYNYEKGAYTEIPFTWNNSSKTLTIGERKGSFKGMLAQRTFNVRLFNGNTVKVNYNGTVQKIKVM